VKGGGFIAYEYKGYNPANSKHVKKYRKSHYKEINVSFPLAYYEDELKPLCEYLNLPVSTFIRDCVVREVDRITKK